MKLLSTFTFAAAVAAVACTGDSLTTPDPAGQALSPADIALDAQAGSSGCYTVELREHTEQEPFGDAGYGTLSGDMAGTVEVAIVGMRFTHGAVIFNEVAVTWRITGGEVTELIGKELALISRGNVVHMPGQDPAVLRMNSRVRARSGVERVNLTSHATFDTRGTPWVIDAVYHGVICP